MARGPAYRLVTARLVLRPWQPADAAAANATIARNLAHLAAMPWAKREPMSLEDKTAQLRIFRGRFDLDEDYAYAVFDAGETAVLGAAGLHKRVGDGALEIGYWIDVDHNGRGLASEAAGALTRVGFAMGGIDRIEIHCAPTNAASARVAEKLGYTCEATLRGRHRDAEGRPRDTMFWSLFAADFAASPAAQLAVQAFDAAGQRLV